MKLKTIAEKYKALQEIRSDANRMIIALRDECDHPMYTAKYGANTGNYCESDDSYWVDFNCPDCGWSKHVYSDDKIVDRFTYRGNHHPRIIK